MTATRQGVLLGLGVAVAAYLLSFFHRVAPAAISGDLQSAFAIGGAQLGTLAATYFYVYTLLQIPVGVLADTLGPRRILAAGSLLAGAVSSAAWYGSSQTRVAKPWSASASASPSLPCSS